MFRTPENNDPLSNLSGNILLVGVVGFAGCLLAWFLLVNLNLMLGIEKDVKAVVATSQVNNGPRSTSFDVVFKIDNGGELSQNFRKYQYSKLKLAPDAEVELRLDGLLWSQVVAVNAGDGFVRVP